MSKLLTHLDPDTKGLSATLFLIFFLFLISLILNKKIHKLEKLDLGSIRQLKVYLKYFVTALFFSGLITIWSSELKSFGLSIMAFSVALVIAGKEVILCLISALYKSLSRISKIGDRIEIHGLRGDVIFSDFLSTTILEVGPDMKSHQHTGRAIVIPNSYFLQHRTINESFLKDYVLHIFSIPINIKSKIEIAKKCLEKITQKVSAPYLESATLHIHNLQKKRSVETPDPKPRVFISYIDSENIEFIIRISVPFKKKGELEQKIITDFIKTKNLWLTRA